RCYAEIGYIDSDATRRSPDVSPSFTLLEGSTGNLGQGVARGTSPLGSRLATRGGIVVEDRGLGSNSGMGVQDSSVRHPSHFLKAILETSGKMWLVEQRPIQHIICMLSGVKRGT